MSALLPARVIYITLGFALAILLPYWMAYERVVIGSSHPDLASINWTAFGAAAAIIASYPIIGAIIPMPRTRSISYILITFLLIFLIVAIILKFSLVGYLGTQLAASYFLVATFSVAYWYIDKKTKFVNFIILPGCADPDIPSFSRLTIQKPLQPPEILRKRDVIVADLRVDLPFEWEKFLARAALQNIPIYHVKQLVENMTGRVVMDHLSENTFGAIVRAPVFPLLKRWGDVVVCVFLAPIFSVILMIAGLLIKLDSRGPVIFRQQRMGYGGKPFTVLKLRSMTTATTEPGPHFTLVNDVRVTRIGRFLRKYRIDELPQIWNVFRGEMSWIGPRPEALTLSSLFEAEIPFYSYRHTVRPGLSGWAQVNQGNTASVDAAREKLEFDFFYIKHFSFWLDLVIILKTVKTICTGFGSH